MKCFKCDSDVFDERADFCPKCGTRFEEKKSCPSCGQLLDHTYKYCVFCGENLDERCDSVANDTTLAGKSDGVYQNENGKATQKQYSR